MRQIQKRNEPQSLTQWRAVYQNDPNFAYDLIDANLREVIRKALVVEQGGLCAYTGRRVDKDSCHIEHLKPQAHCANGEDVSFGNMVACVPAPNAPGLPYGAHKKGSWPDVTQEALFVSPIQPGCGTRFSFNLRGEIKPRNPADHAAMETIRRLRLDHTLLDQLRKAAINGTLRVHGRGPASLDRTGARRRITSLSAAEQDNSILEPFSFVLQQALEKHIVRLEAIRDSRRGTR